MTINEIVRAVYDGKASEDKTAEDGIVRVMVKTHYGRQHYYPANPTADLFRKIQGGKTLTEPTLKALKEGGYKIQYRYEEPAI
jgi:signal transduction histidine kinase